VWGKGEREGLLWLLGVVFDVIALQLDELVIAKLAQSLTFSRILPSYPGQILGKVTRSVKGGCQGFGDLRG